MSAIEGKAEFPVIAILVSRVEALCLVSMLEDNGILVHVDGLNHASVEFISLALGGHRISVSQHDYDKASALIRETGAADNWEFSFDHRKAVIRMLCLWGGIQCVAAFWALMASLASVWSWVFLPLSILAMPINPQGRGDYFLSAQTAD
ncbi:MAG: hypothetical protein WAT93_15430 [Pontixanthobacter sp.]